MWETSEHFPEPDDDAVQLLDLFRALADPSRLWIAKTLTDGTLHPCRVEEFGLSIQKSTLSHHFKILRESGLTSTRVRGREAAVRLRLEMLDVRFPGLVQAIRSSAR